MIQQTIDVKNVFQVFYYLFFIKNLFFTFLLFGTFLFSSEEFCYPTKFAKILLNLLNFCIKRLLSDGFNMAAIANSLMKSRSPQTLSYNIKTVILQRNFSFGLINFVNLSTTFLYNVFKLFFIFSKKRVHV